MDADTVEYEHQELECDIDAGLPQSEEVETQVSGRKKKKTSSVWNHMTRVDSENDTCNYCGNNYAASSSLGTSHLLRHLKHCMKKPKFGNVTNMLVDYDGKLRTKKIDQKVWREKLAKLIICHELPFAFVEYEAFKELILYANPDIKMICRNTASSDVMKLYEDERDKLKLQLANVRSRICLTSDLWTSITHEGYICVTAHYVDENWKLKSKILSFCTLALPQTGMEISKKIFGCLKDWGIEKKIFYLTLDNASANDSMQDILKHQLSLHNNLLCKCEFFHIRCSAHILNIIVQEGLKVISDALEKIRESVKYVRASEARMKAFDECVEQVGGNIRASLCMDVATRWNSTHMMLVSALNHRYALH